MGEVRDDQSPQNRGAAGTVGNLIAILGGIGGILAVTFAAIQYFHHAPPPTANLTAYPTAVLQGHTSTLAWQTTDATSVIIQEVGPELQLPPNGSQQVTLEASTTYHLIATGPGGTKSANAQIAVQAPGPGETMSPYTASIKENGAPPASGRPLTATQETPEIRPAGPVLEILGSNGLPLEGQTVDGQIGQAKDLFGSPVVEEDGRPQLELNFTMQLRNSGTSPSDQVTPKAYSNEIPFWQQSDDASEGQYEVPRAGYRNYDPRTAGLNPAANPIRDGLPGGGFTTFVLWRLWLRNNLPPGKYSMSMRFDYGAGLMKESRFFVNIK